MVTIKILVFKILTRAKENVINVGHDANQFRVSCTGMFC